MLQNYLGAFLSCKPVFLAQVMRRQCMFMRTSLKSA